MEPGGIILIRGRIMRNQEELLGKAGRWLDEYISCPADLTCVNIFLEYAPDIHHNLILLLRKIMEVNLNHKRLIVNWYYEEGDEDIHERGEYTSTLLDYPFNFIMISDTCPVSYYELTTVCYK